MTESHESPNEAATVSEEAGPSQVHGASVSFFNMLQELHVGAPLVPGAWSRSTSPPSFAHFSLLLSVIEHTGGILWQIRSDSILNFLFPDAHGKHSGKHLGIAHVHVQLSQSSSSREAHFMFYFTSES